MKDVEDGRINYYRAKTNRLYSIKVEPEALAIIEKYRGKDDLIDLLDTYRNETTYRQNYDNGIKVVNPRRKMASLLRTMRSEGYRPTGRGILGPQWPQGLTSPKETIAAALGRGGHTVTDIYIDFDQKKVDEANRRVIDYVLYNKM